MKSIIFLIGFAFLFACSDKTTERIGRDIPEHNKASFHAAHSSATFEAQKAALETRARLEQFGIRKLYFSGDLAEVERVYQNLVKSTLNEVQKNELKLPLMYIMHERLGCFENIEQEKRQFYAKEMIGMVKGGIPSFKLFADLYSNYFKNEYSKEDQDHLKEALVNGLNWEIDRLSKQNDVQYSDMAEYAKSKGIAPLSYEEFMKMKKGIAKSNEEQTSTLIRLKNELIKI